MAWRVLMTSLKHLLILSHLRHLRLGIGDEEGHVVDLILDHKVLLFPLEVLHKKQELYLLHYNRMCEHTVKLYMAHCYYNIKSVLKHLSSMFENTSFYLKLIKYEV